MPSPFFVDPMNNQGANLAGIGNIIGAGAEKRKAMEQQQIAENEVMEAFNSQDPNQIAAVSMKYPEVSENFNSGLQLGDEMQQEAATDFQRTLMLLPEEQRLQAFDDRIAEITARGGDPANTLAAKEDYMADAEGFMLENEMVFAAREGDQYEIFKKSLAGETPTGNVQRSVEIPGKGFNLVYEDGSVIWKPYEADQAAAYAASQEEAVEQARTVAEETAAAEGVVRSRQAMEDTVNTGAFKARENMPRITRMMQLAEVADTGAFGDLQTAVKRIFDLDVADEEEFMALANQEILAAADSLSGALSERENEYLEAVGPSIGKSREGNMRIIRNLAVIANNAIQRQNAWKEHRAKDLPTSEFQYIGNDFNGTVLPVNRADLTTEELLKSLTD